MLPKSALDIADDVEGLDEEKWNLQVVQKRPLASSRSHSGVHRIDMFHLAYIHQVPVV